MASVLNTEARLLTAPKIEGHPIAQWVPGKNRLDAEYWQAIENHRTIERWLLLGWIEIDLDEELPDPTVPPSVEELAEFSAKELAAALKNPTVPVQWHPALEGEIEKRRSSEIAKRLPPKVPPVKKERKSLSGLKVADARALIDAESDIDTLEAWADADKRTTIEAAIDDRLAALALDDDTNGSVDLEG